MTKIYLGNDVTVYVLENGKEVSLSKKELDELVEYAQNEKTKEKEEEKIKSEEQLHALQ